MSSFPFRRTLSFALLLTFLTGCQSPYFEGTITYAITTKYHEDNERYRKYYEEEKFGETMVLYARSDGAVRRIYPSSSEQYGSLGAYYSPAENRIYASYRFMDTIMTSLASAEILDNKQLSNCTGEVITEILGKPVDCLEMTGRDTIGNYNLRTRYYYPQTGLKIDHAAYQNYREFDLGKAYARSQAHFLRMELDYGNYSTVLEATGIQPRKLEDGEISVPKGVPLKNVD